MTRQAPLLLTETEAAEQLRLSARTLRKARADGQLHYVLIGRAVRYTIEDLESYIASLRQERQCPPQPSPAPRSTRRRRRDNVVPFKTRRAAG